MFARLVVLLAVLAVACAFRANMQMKSEMSFNKVVASAMAGIFALNGLSTLPAQAFTKDQVDQLSYLQVKGTGLANRCPDVIGEDAITISGGRKYKLTDLCLEPKSWQVEEEVAVKKGVAKKEFVNTKLMTRQTYTLADVSGTIENKDGGIQFQEQDGIDYAATTVQLPGGERVPFLFSLKGLVAKGNGATIKPGFEMGGSVVVPSYRTGLFLDPKGRGTTTGYDQAGALPGIQNGVDGDAELFKENNKVFDVLSGDVEFAVNRVNVAEGEFGGVFVSKQAGDTDMGGKEAKSVLSKGIFFGHLEEI
jgi:photosystem II oxygen-evolving enhancer protein 1